MAQQHNHNAGVMSPSPFDWQLDPVRWQVSPNRYTDDISPIPFESKLDPVRWQTRAPSFEPVERLGGEYSVSPNALPCEPPFPKGTLCEPEHIFYDPEEDDFFYGPEKKSIFYNPEAGELFYYDPEEDIFQNPEEDSFHNPEDTRFSLYRHLEPCETIGLRRSRATSAPHADLEPILCYDPSSERRRDVSSLPDLSWQPGREHISPGGPPPPIPTVPLSRQPGWFLEGLPPCPNARSGPFMPPRTIVCYERFPRHPIEPASPGAPVAPGGPRGPAAATTPPSPEKPQEIVIICPLTPEALPQEPGNDALQVIICPYSPEQHPLSIGCPSPRQLAQEPENDTSLFAIRLKSRERSACGRRSTCRQEKMDRVQRWLNRTA